jgi:diguanylate cyclase (GGDEF)-like protein
LFKAKKYLIRPRHAAEGPRARSNMMFPIGIIVAVAFVCVIIAAVTSARRADEVAIEQETQLLVTGIRNHADLILREIKSISTGEQTADRIVNADRRWIAGRIGGWLKAFFRHDFVFVIDGDDSLLYPSGHPRLDPVVFRNNLGPVLGLLRGTKAGPSTPYRILSVGGRTYASEPAQATLLQVFAGRPALVAGVAVGKSTAATDTKPAIVAIRYIDDEILADIAGRLQLRNLRMVTGGRVPDDDQVYDVMGGDGRTVVRFAWTPLKPGAEIVASVLPFIAVAFFGFVLLAAFVLHHMRRTAQTIASTEKRLRHLAMHDPLCGLPNRIYFSDRLEDMIRTVRMGGPAAAVFYVDLDHFKDVNDLLGHPVGDELITGVATRLIRVMRQSDVVARLGGDEFAVIRTVEPDSAALYDVAERIISALCAPYALAEQSIVIGASIGIAVIDQNSGSAADVMRHADMALYRAKNEGRNRACIYDAAMDADLVHRKMLQDDLREAIASDGLRLEYQPVVNTSGEKVIGVEALARWRHPVYGEIQPSEFIPIAEHSGLIVDLGAWVLRRACIDGNDWPSLTVAVNVSPMQFRRTDFVEGVERTLVETGFDAGRLELEVTESTLFGNVESAQAAMLRLKALGVKLALDDFGTGYSSLQYLRRFPFDRLKVDHSFVHGIEAAADAAAIVHAIVSLGRGLGMKVTAEGVETAEQQLFLRAAGVHAMQGYRFGRPVPADQVADFHLPDLERPFERYAAAGGR